MESRDFSAYSDLRRRIAAYGLNEDGEIRVPDETWPLLFGSIALERLCGVAFAAAEQGRLALSDEQASSLHDAHLDATLRSLALERGLLALHDALEEAAIPFVVLKGPALAYQFYDEPWWRPFSDVDLLVRGENWRGACAVLQRIGYRRELPEPRQGFDERFGKAAAHRNDVGLTIDLHRRLVLGPFGLWFSPEALFERTETFEVAGRSLHRLDDTSLLLHACVHASLGWWPPLLLPVRDVAQVTARGAIDWERFRSEATRWRLRAVVAHAFGLVRTELGLPLAPEAERAAAMRGTPREQRVLAAYTSGKRSRGGTEWSTLRALPGAREKIAFIRDLALPRREFLAARSVDGRRSSYIRRWTIPFRWLRDRSQ
jgi:hypothetical protein